MNLSGHGSLPFWFSLSLSHPLSHYHSPSLDSQLSSSYSAHFWDSLDSNGGSHVMTAKTTQPTRKKIPSLAIHHPSKNTRGLSMTIWESGRKKLKVTVVDSCDSFFCWRKRGRERKERKVKKGKSDKETNEESVETERWSVSYCQWIEVPKVVLLFLSTKFGENSPVLYH